MIKTLCSTDDIPAEKKFEAPMSYVPSHTLVLCTNHLPNVGCLDEGTWRRIIIVPFNAHIEPNNDIKDYAGYLYENAGGAILSWIIEGAKKAYDLDYRINLPDCVSKAIGEYKKDNDWMQHFLDDCCEISADYEDSSQDLYMAYREYCDRVTGEYRRNRNDFSVELQKRGFEKVRTKSMRGYKGLKLTEECTKWIVPF